MIPAPKEILNLTPKKSVAICPDCNVWVALRAKKKDKTYSLFEYKRHYTEQHNI